MAEHMTAAHYRLSGGETAAKLRADFAAKVAAGKTMHSPVRVLSREEIAALNCGRQEQPAPRVAAPPPPPPVRECAHRPRRDPDGDLRCVECGEWVDEPPRAEPAPEVCAAPYTVKGSTKLRRNSARRKRPRPVLPPAVSARLAELHDLLAMLRVEPMSVLARHLAMGLGRPEEAVEHDLRVLREFGLAKCSAAGRWRAKE